MSLTPEVVKKIGLLARLKLDESSLPALASELSKVLDLVETISQQDTTGVQPLAHPLDLELRLREDVVSEHPDREKLQKNAPQTASGLYLVPAVIE